MQRNRTDQAPKDSNPTFPVRTAILPTYIEEDPELTPERWWARRQRQSLTGL
jgi:hypothetical protein